jgi:hypothetical protein
MFKYSLVEIPDDCRSILASRHHNAETTTDADILNRAFMPQKCHRFIVELQMTLGGGKLIYVNNYLPRPVPGPQLIAIRHARTRTDLEA